MSQESRTVKPSNRQTAGGRWQKADGRRLEGQKPVEGPRGQGVEKAAHRAPRTASPTPSSLRLFYALRVPTEISSELAGAQRLLKGNWRAVNPGQMHVTLAYLPSVPPARLDDLKRLGTRLMQDLPPMQIGLRGTGYFPNEGSPRVWFAKVEAEGLSELAANLREGLAELGLESEQLPFKAHITLARKKGPAPRVPPKMFDHLGWTASGGTLYRSILRKTGPIYEVESTFRFRGNPPPGPPLDVTESSPTKTESSAPTPGASSSESPKEQP